MSKFIVLSNIIYQDHHLLVNMLNQNGHIYTILCIGGQGSVKKQTGKKVETGHIIEINALTENNKSQHFYLKEFELLWSPWKIRHHFQAWCLLNFMLEVAHKTLPSKDLNHHEWLELKSAEKVSNEYEVLVKFLFFAEELALQTFKNNQLQHFCLFYLAKVMQLQGVFPRIGQCYNCDVTLSRLNIASFQSSYFYCQQCQPKKNKIENFWLFLNFVKSTKYEELKILPWENWPKIEASSFLDSVDQFFTMLHLSKSSLKTFNVIFEK